MHAPVQTGRDVIADPQWIPFRYRSRQIYVKNFANAASIAACERRMQKAIAGNNAEEIATACAIVRHKNAHAHDGVVIKDGDILRVWVEVR